MGEFAGGGKLSDPTLTSRLNPRGKEEANGKKKSQMRKRYVGRGTSKVSTAIAIKRKRGKRTH